MLEAPESMLGETLECPKCGVNSRLMTPGSQQDFDLPDSLSSQRTKSSGGMFDAMLGNASTLDTKTAKSEVNHLLVPNEQIQLAFKLVRDLFIFTDRRLLLIDKQGLTGKKVECHTIPYKSIVHFSVETAGTFDRDAELKIFVSGNPVPIEKQFKKNGANIFEVQKALAIAVVD